MKPNRGNSPCLANALFLYLLFVVSVSAFAPSQSTTRKARPGLHFPFLRDHPRESSFFQSRTNNFIRRGPTSLAKRRPSNYRPAWKSILGKAGRRRFQFVTLLCFLLTLVGHARPAMAVSKAAASDLPVTLGTKNVVTASAVIALIGGLGLTRLGMGGLASQLLVACARCALQLQVLGGLILQWLLPCSQPWLIGGWIVGVGIIAAQESYGRLEYTYPKLRRHLTFSFLIGGLTVLGLCMAGEILGKLEPFYKPQTIIPIAGMLFGNSLSAVTVAGSTLTRSFATQKPQIELWLARGATYDEAILPLTKSSIKTALMPTINALSVTGIVHLPGMMTGQILAGQSPRQAAIYQTLIWFLIASVATNTVQILNSFVTRTLVDTRQHRLELDGLRHVKATKDERSGETGLSAPSKVTMTSSSTSSPALRIENLLIKRANVELNLDLRLGDRIGITGPSGIGKSQILRTIAALEPVQSKEIKEKPLLEVKGIPMSKMLPPEWRTKVCFVSQDHPTEIGTPREFLEQVQKFRYQQKRKTKKTRPKINGESENEVRDPIKMASEEWDLPVSVWDRPWSTLSGGEAQRVSLAIALSLHPDVLLLDEMSSALDVVTTMRVEKTLQDMEIPLIAVTHDRYQLERFCTHHIELPSATTERLSQRP